MENVLKDDRFSHIAKDPRFWQMPKNEKKVKIDSRFKAMFTDERFQVKYTVDKRGRPINTSSRDNLKKFYDISSDDDEEEEKQDKSKKPSQKQKRKETLDSLYLKKPPKTKRNQKDIETHTSENINENIKRNKKKNADQTLNDEIKFKSEKVKKQNKKKNKVEINMDEEEEDDDSEEGDDDKIDANEESDNNEDVVENDNDKDVEDNDDEDSEDDDDSSDYDGSDEEIDRARGVGDITSSSSEEEFEFDADDAFDHNWMEIDKDVPEIQDASNRLAVCNLDWDRIKANDIYLMLNSFKPADGYIQSVAIYPSEFGLQRMKEEEFQGPKELTEKLDDLPQTADEIQEGEQFHRERLRQYQMNRLKYYYAVVVCDSVASATKLYDDCDGIEFETSCTKIDLRFIPDNMTFDEKPKSLCTGVENYKPNYFSNSALGCSQVKLTWDDTDHDRLRITMTKVDPKKIESLENDYEAYIASSSDEEVDPKLPQSGSSDSDSDDENNESRLQKYRQLLQDLDDKKAKKEDVEMEITWEPGLKGTTESIVKQTIEAEKTVTPWQGYLQKKKDKKKQRNKDRKSAREKALVESGEAPEERDAFSDDELPEGVDMTDPYFKSEMKDAKKKKKKGKTEELTEEQLEQKKQEEAKLKLLMMDEEDNRSHFSLDQLLKDAKKKKKKKKKKDIEDDEVGEKTDNFQVDVSDPRFSALFESHLFNVDPSAPEYKKTKGSEMLINEKLKRRKTDGYTMSSNRKRKASNVDNSDLSTSNEAVAPKESLSSLLQSVKAKTQKYNEKKKKKS